MRATIPPRLVRLREEIEAIDRELVALIARRVALAREAGVVKRAAGMPVVDPAREQAVLARAVDHARDAGLPEDELRELMHRVVTLSRRAQDHREGGDAAAEEQGGDE